MTRGRIAALALAVAAGIAPADAAPPPPSYRVGKVGTEIAYEVYRTSSSPRQLEIQFQIDQTPHELSTIQSIALARRGARWTLPNGWDDGFTGYAELGTGEAWPAVYGLPAKLPSCPHPVACTSLFGHVTFTARSAEPDYLTFYFQLTDASALVTIKTPGWRLRKTKAVRFRRVLADQVSTGARSGAELVERFTHAELPGGRYGSRARTYLPCDDFGWGDARLTGGVDEPALSRARPYCRGVIAKNETWGEDWAFTPTTWRVTGDVVGAGRFHARLVVVDFPKP